MMSATPLSPSGWCARCLSLFVLWSARVHFPMRAARRHRSSSRVVRAPSWCQLWSSSLPRATCSAAFYATSHPMAWCAAATRAHSSWEPSPAWRLLRSYPSSQRRINQMVGWAGRCNPSCYCLVLELAGLRLVRCGHISWSSALSSLARRTFQQTVSSGVWRASSPATVLPALSPDQLLLDLCCAQTCSSMGHAARLGRWSLPTLSQVLFIKPQHRQTRTIVSGQAALDQRTPSSLDYAGRPWGRRGSLLAAQLNSTERSARAKTQAQERWSDQLKTHA